MTPSKSPPRWQVVTAFAAVYLIWGSTYLGIAFAIQTVPPFIMTGVRFLLAGSILFTWARLSGAPKPTPRQWRATAILGVLFFLCGNGAVTWVEQRMPSGITAVLVAMVTAWTVLIEWSRPGGRRPAVSVLAGIVTGFLGVALLLLPGRVSHVGQVDFFAVGLLMVTSMLWAVGSVFSREAGLPANTFLTAGMEMLGGGAALMLASVVAGDWARLDLAAITPKSALAFLYLVTFGSLIGFTAFAWLLTVTTPSKVSTYGYVNPMVAVILGWALNGEVLTFRSLVASAIIVGSVVVIVTGRSIARRANGTPQRPAGRLPEPARAPNDR